jgi:hypothetical protein
MDLEAQLDSNMVIVGDLTRLTQMLTSNLNCFQKAHLKIPLTYGFED